MKTERKGCAVSKRPSIVERRRLDEEVARSKSKLTCIRADVDRLWANSAVYFDVLFGEAGAEVGYLGYAALQELLASSTCVLGYSGPT